VRALAIVHQSDAGPGVFFDACRERGVVLDSWRLPDGDPPPGDPFSYDAVLTFGGAMHPDEEDRHPWLAAEKDLLAELLARRTPLLGVCLGAELVAAAAGGTARRAPAPEIGWHRVSLTVDGARDRLLAWAAPGFDAFQWHSYEFLLPPGATALATSERSLQAFRIGERAWGIQFHAEVTLSDAEAWIADYRSDEDAVAVGLDAGALAERTRASIGAWNELGRGLCGRFLDVAAAATQAPRA
jgi:GMP synthase-like glutamine amidotransferase